VRDQKSCTPPTVGYYILLYIMCTAQPFPLVYRRTFAAFWSRRARYRRILADVVIIIITAVDGLYMSYNIGAYTLS